MGESRNRVAGAYALNTAVKLLVRRPRPQLPDLPPLLATPTQLSFPSAHATSGFAGALVYSRLGLPAAPLYVLAAAKLLGIDPTNGAAAYVYPTRKGEFQVVEWTPEDLAARHAEVLRLLDAIVSAVRRGDLLIAPADGACDYCAFSEICPGSYGGYAERKATDERLGRLATEIRSVP